MTEHKQTTINELCDLMKKRGVSNQRLLHDIAHAMSKYQEIHSITGQCVYNSLYLCRIAKCLNFPARIKAVIVVELDDGECLKVVSGHYVVDTCDTHLDASHDINRNENASYYDNFGEFNRRHTSDDKPALRKVLQDFLIWSNDAVFLNENHINIEDDWNIDYYKEQHDFVVKVMNGRVCFSDELGCNN